MGCPNSSVSRGRGQAAVASLPRLPAQRSIHAVPAITGVAFATVRCDTRARLSPAGIYRAQPWLCKASQGMDCGDSCVRDWKSQSSN